MNRPVIPFAVDIDSQLRKLPGRRFSSPHHFAVELVRDAARRGATRVEVSLSWGKAVFKDDGRSLDGRLLDELLALFDMTGPESRRQQALARFEEGEGTELLAPFAPGPSLVVIESGPVERRRSLRFAPGRPPGEVEAAEGLGTTVTVVRRFARWNEEAEALADHCRFARIPILVNGRRVSGQGPPDAIAFSELTDPAGTLWLSGDSDQCRIWLLEHGVRTRQFLLPPASGFIFNAAVALPGPPDQGTVRSFAAAAEELYRLLAGRYRSLPVRVRDRLDQLLFTHYRVRGPSALTLSYAPFRALAPADQYLALAEVQRQAQTGQLLALKAEEEPAGHDLSGGTVIRPSPRQWEFLVRDCALDLKGPVRLPGIGLRLERLRTLVAGGALRRAVAARLAVWRQPLTTAQLEPGERKLARALASALPNRDSGGDFTVVVQFVAGHGPQGGVRLEGAGGVRLVLFRSHPRVRAAVAALGERPLPARMLLASLLAGEP